MIPIGAAQGWLDGLWAVQPARRAVLEDAADGSETARRTIELATGRLGSIVDRQMGPAIAALITGLFISPALALLVIAINLACEAADTALNLHLVHRARAADLIHDRYRTVQVANALFGAGGHCSYVALCWMLGPPELRIFCFCFLSLAAIHTAFHINAVRYVLVARESAYVATATALCLWDLLSPGGVESTLAWVQVIVAVTIGYRFWTWIVLVLDREDRSLSHARSAEEARDAALRASDARMRYFAVVSHELRTPLNGILGMTQGLLSGPLAPDQREKAEVIAESGRTLTALLSDVLDLSKMDAGRLDIHPAPESFHAGLRHVMTLYRPLAEEKSIGFRLDLAEDVPDWLLHDGVRLRQCLSNLVSNAIKFTDRGQIVVSVSSRPVAEVPERLDELVVEVRDTGIGLSPEARERLFEPFTQADPSIPQHYGGTGLGLSIARRLARLMGGDVTCRPGEAGGSVFTLTFRAAHAVPPYRTGASSVPAKVGNAPGLRVLIADDVETNRAVARLFLEPLRISAVEAPDGTAALELLRRGGIDAALLDLRMPGMSGEELIRAIRAGEAGDPDLPVLAVTADHLSDPAALGAAGFDGLVIKPMDQRALQTALMSVLAAHLVRPRRTSSGSGGAAGA
jgi:signal transduction histidine kinase/CheY-like chemotaxis protein